MIPRKYLTKHRVVQIALIIINDWTSSYTHAIFACLILVTLLNELIPGLPL